MQNRKMNEESRKKIQQKMIPKLKRFHTQFVASLKLKWRFINIEKLEEP